MPQYEGKDETPLELFEIAAHVDFETLKGTVLVGHTDGSYYLLSTADARTMAGKLLLSCAMAESDAMMVQWASERFGYSPEQARSFLQDIRFYRDKMTEEKPVTMSNMSMADDVCRCGHVRGEHSPHSLACDRCSCGMFRFQERGGTMT